MSLPNKYVVIMEIPSNGYIDCIGIYDNAEQAYGEAYLSLCDGLDSKEYYITFPEDREGENGCCISVVNKQTLKDELVATVLFYREERQK